MPEPPPDTITITVLFFGHYRDFAREPIALSLPAGATVALAASRLFDRDARFADLLLRTRQAVGAEFVGPTTVLQKDDELAFLPPMSGG